MSPIPQEELLARFSAQIDLPAYLGQRGYEVVAGSTNPTYVAMANNRSKEILFLRKDPEPGGWSYRNANDPRDRGSIVEYLDRHESLSRAEGLERIIACVDPRRRDVPQAESYRAYLHEKPQALRDAEAKHDRANRDRSDALKELARVGIQPSTLPEWRLGSWQGGPSAVARILEEPSHLWASRYKPTDKTLIIAERPIDAISYGQTRREENACYLAIGGELTPTRKRQLAHLLADLPSGMSVVLAFGRDQAGRQLANDLQGLAPLIKMDRAQPDFGSRWNDQLQLENRHARSLQRGGLGLQR
jgi:Toprim-like